MELQKEHGMSDRSRPVEKTLPGNKELKKEHGSVTRREEVYLRRMRNCLFADARCTITPKGSVGSAESLFAPHVPS